MGTTNKEQMIDLLQKAQAIQTKWAKEYKNLAMTIYLKVDEENNTWFAVSAMAEDNEETWEHEGMYPDAAVGENLVVLNRLVNRVEAFGIPRV